VMLRLNSPPRCRSSGAGWKLARVRCVAGSNTSLRHLFCKSALITHPKRQFLISSIRGVVKKKHNCIDRSLSCFRAHVNEPDRFEPSAPKPGWPGFASETITPASLKTQYALQRSTFGSVVNGCKGV